MGLYKSVDLHQKQSCDRCIVSMVRTGSTILDEDVKETLRFENSEESRPSGPPTIVINGVMGPR